MVESRQKISNKGNVGDEKPLAQKGSVSKRGKKAKVEDIQEDAEEPEAEKLNKSNGKRKVKDEVKEEEVTPKKRRAIAKQENGASKGTPTRKLSRGLAY